MLLNIQCVIEEIEEYPETNRNENTMFPNVWDTAKAVLRGKFIEIQAYLRKKEKPQINLTPKGTRKRRKKPQITRRKEILKFKVGRSEIETKITTEKINETKSWFFEKINKIDKLSQTH